MLINVRDLDAPEIEHIYIQAVIILSVRLSNQMLLLKIILSFSILTSRKQFLDDNSFEQGVYYWRTMCIKNYTKI